MNIIPRRGRESLQAFSTEMGDMFRRFFGDDDFAANLPDAFRGGRIPPVDIAEGEKDMTFAFELPGLEEKDFQVEIMGNQLVVSGERKWEQTRKEKEYHRVESQYGTFRRSVMLPQGLRTQPNDVMATYKQGILEIRIPKVEPTPASRIKVAAG